MQMTDRYAAWLHALAVRDNLVLQIAILAGILAVIYWLFRGSPRELLGQVTFVGVFYASLGAYFCMGL